MTTSDPYASEAARLRSLVQEHLRAGTEPTLTPYEQLLLCGWYERELARLEVREGALVNTIDTHYADRLERARADMAAVRALDGLPGGFDERTASPLDDAEGPP